MSADAREPAQQPTEREGHDATEEPRTPGGLPLRPVYPLPRGSELPGEFPFTRGVHADMYRGRLWTFRQYSGFGTAVETNRRFHYLIEQGQTGLSVAFDLPTQIGYDSDHPLAGGEVGKVGVPISCLGDMDDLLDGIPLDRVSISMTINTTASILLAFLVALARRRGIPLASLRGTLQNDILKEYIARRTYRFPIRPSLRLVTDVLEYSTGELPLWNPISVSGYHLREAGCNAVQEVGLTFANAIAYVEEARARGIDLETICRRISFFWAAHNHLFEEVAKFRASRRLWARIVRERFGVRDPAAARLRFHTQTAGSTLTFQEPENNAARVTLQALAAVLGGTQSLHTNAIDEALGLPTRRSARTALRTQQVIAHESGVADVADPLGGCPLVEELTDSLETAARGVIEEIDAHGGAVAAIEKGIPQTLIEEEAYQNQRRIESGEQVVVGVNRFREEAAGEESPLAVHKIDPELEATRRREIAAYKKGRDESRVAALRRELERTARGPDNTLVPLVACAEGGVTLGEMVETLAGVFGEHRD
ncbi:MAG: methylmalonyl-CoA mutase family protein [Planctomycetota bacterium]|nr:methylmalonyl-CoA mutase family protein [Planctomycetota bacterium]